VRSKRHSVGRRRLVVAAVLVSGLVLGGCVGGGADDGTEDAGEAPGGVAAPAPEITVTPADGERRVRPDRPVAVRVSGGTLTDVVVEGLRGARLAGATDAPGTEWTADDPLAFGRAYTVRATATGPEGTRATETTRFRTLRPRRVVDVSVAPLDGETVGVGMPVVVYFDEPVADKSAVERRLEVRATPAVEGVWHWFSDTEVHYRPRQFWEPGSRVTLDVGLAGTRVAPGVWSDEAREVSFDVGASMVSVVDVDRKRMVVRRNGEVVRRIPVTTGKASFLTRGGTKVVLEKHRAKVMDASTIGISPGDPEYYNLRVEWAMRVTWSGEFVHSAPWSVGSQGATNVSHGCVGMAPAQAIWLYQRSQRGDVVKVVNSGRPLEKGNGFTDWDMSWTEYRQGSALT
jgi:lipoprotein-anchoring transpeptidase ErfK/SrfK